MMREPSEHGCYGAKGCGVDVLIAGPEGWVIEDILRLNQDLQRLPFGEPDIFLQAGIETEGPGAVERSGAVELRSVPARPD